MTDKPRKDPAPSETALQAEAGIQGEVRGAYAKGRFGLREAEIGSGHPTFQKPVLWFPIVPESIQDSRDANYSDPEEKDAAGYLKESLKSIHVRKISFTARFHYLFNNPNSSEINPEAAAAYNHRALIQLRQWQSFHNGILPPQDLYLFGYEPGRPFYCVITRVDIKVHKFSGKRRLVLEAEAEMELSGLEMAKSGGESVSARAIHSYANSLGHTYEVSNPINLSTRSSRGRYSPSQTLDFTGVF